MLAASIRLGEPGGPDARAVFREASLFNGLANAGHQRLVIAQVVQRVEARTEDFIRFLEVKQVGARKAPAGVAVAALVQRPRVRAMAGVADLDVAMSREKPAI